MNLSLRVNQKATSIDELKLDLVEQAPSKPVAGFALVQVKAAAINPSDAKATLGIMPKAVFPRTPGRDFSGVVIDGPTEWIGKEVFGSGGDIGITRDGSHGSYLNLPVGALRLRPMNITIEEAGAIGVPFVTAYEGYRRSGLPQAGMTVAVMGANGKVGQAAIQIAAMYGAKVIAVQRKPAFESFACSPVKVVNSSNLSPEQIAQEILQLSDGKGANIIYNTVGSAYFEAANKSLAKGGTQIFIATQDRAVPFDIFTFYRGMHTYVGIDTLALDCVTSNTLLDALRPGFESLQLKPFPVDQVFTLQNAHEAYKLVLSGSDKRIVFQM
jgi:NADPH:quinone reductase-like Zn-dependent oxidoreductase